MTRKLFWMIFVAPVLGATALSAGAEQAEDSLFRHAENALQDEARVLHRDFTSPERWRDWTLDRANGEDADIQAWMSSRWKETPGRLADSLAGSAASWVGAGLRESEWVETLDFGFQLPLEGRTGWMNLNAIGPLSRGEDSVLGWQLPLSFGSADDDGETEMVGNVGLFYRRTLGDWGLAGVNLFGDYQDEGANGDFWRWSVGAEYRTSWADVFVNRYIPSSPAQRTLLSGGTQERIAYSAGGYDAEVRFHAPRSRWLEGFAEYSLWEGEYGDADDSGFRYGFRLLPRTGSLADGLRFEADYDDTLDGGWGARFSYDWTLGQKPRRSGYAAFDPRAHLFAPVERRHGQNIRTRVRSLRDGGVSGVARSALVRDCKSDPASWSDDVASAVNVSLTMAAAVGDVQGVCDALDGINNDVAANPNYPGDGDADWALHIAATLSTDEGARIVSMLVKASADVNAKGKSKNSPLHRMAEHGAYKSAKVLLGVEGITVDARDNRRATPLHHAARFGSPLIAMALLDAGADKNAVAFVQGGFTQLYPLDYAVREGERDVAQVLLAYGATCRSSTDGWCNDVKLPIPLKWLSGKTLYASADHSGVLLTVDSAASSAGAADSLLVDYAMREGSERFSFNEQARVLSVRDSLTVGSSTVYIEASATQGRLIPVTATATLLVSVLSNGDSRFISASPYAKGGFLTLSSSVLPGLSLTFAMADGAEELTVESSGKVMWTAGAVVAVSKTYRMRANASAGELAGTLSFSLDVRAECSGEAAYGDLSAGEFFADVDEGKANSVCWHIGEGQNVNVQRTTNDVEEQTALYMAISNAWLAWFFEDEGGGGKWEEVVGLLLSYGANPNLVAREGGENNRILDLIGIYEGYEDNFTSRAPSGQALDRMAAVVRDAGGTCLHSGSHCGLFWTWPSDAAVTVSHDWSGALLTVAFSALEGKGRSYEVVNESRLTVEERNFVGETGEIVVGVASEDSPLLGGEELTASIVAWSEKQTLSAALAVTVAYGILGELSAADSVFTVAWDYREDLLTLASATEGAALTYAWPSNADVALVSLSPVAAAWRWNGDAEDGGAYQATATVTLSRAHYAARVEQSTISIYAVSQPDGKTLTVSPYAKGEFLTLSHPDLPGLSFKKAQGSSAELLLGAGGVVEWGAGVEVGDYRLEALATAEGLLGTLQFSALVRADCVPGASGHPNANLPGFKQAIESDDEVAVCGHVINGMAVNGIIPENVYGESPLHVAADNNATMAAELLLALGAEVNALDLGGWTPLHWAAYDAVSGVEVARILLSAGGDPNIQGSDEQDSPLHWAAEVRPGTEERREEMILALLRHDGILVNLQDSGGRTALDIAVDESDVISERLSEYGGVCLKAHHFKVQPLCGLYFWPRSADVSVAFQEVKAIYTLTAKVTAEVDFSVGDSVFSLSVSEDSGAGQAAAVVYAVAPSFDDAGELLVVASSGAQVLTMSLNVTVGLAVARNLNPFASRLVATGHEGDVILPPVDDDEANVSYRSMLGGGDFALVTLQSGEPALSLNSPLPAGGATAIMEVDWSKYGYFPSLATMRVALSVLGPFSPGSAVIPPQATSVNYRFAISGFKNAQFEEVGDDDNFYSLSSDGGAILLNENVTLSAGTSHTIVVKGEDTGFFGDILLTLELSVSLCLGSGSSSGLGRQLLQAAKNGDVNLVCDLSRRGADIDTFEQGLLPIHWAARNNHVNVVQYFVSRDATLAEAIGRHEMRPIHVAAEWGSLEVVKYLSGVADLNALGDDSPLLHIAAINARLEVVKFLLPMVDVDVVDGNGWTALHAAVVGELYQSNSEVVEYLWTLIDHTRDNDGRTPAQLRSAINPHVSPL